MAFSVVYTCCFFGWSGCLSGHIPMISSKNPEKNGQLLSVSNSKSRKRIGNSALDTPYISPMKFCTTPKGARVSYQFVPGKDSIPLILLHGFCEDHTVWHSIQSMLSPHTHLLVDMPGFGASDVPTPPDMRTYAEAVLAVLEDAGIERCILAGHSMGGYVALEFAAHWPERLAGLGLIHSHPFEDNAERKTARQRGIETLQAGKRDLYVSQLFPNLFPASFLANHPTLLKSLIDNGKKQSPEGISAALQAMIGRRDHQATLRNLQSPVLFLLGALDTLVPPEQGLLGALLPQLCDVHLLPNIGHMAMFESPEETAAILNSFWDFCIQK